MISNMKVKYENTFGTPINLPPNYKDKFDYFKQLTILTFIICALLLLIFMVYFNSINIVFKDEMVFISYIIRNKFQFFSLLMSFAPVIISLFQLKTANSFSSLTRQDLMR
jgi:hypothetical protein